MGGLWPVKSSVKLFGCTIAFLILLSIFISSCSNKIGITDDQINIQFLKGYSVIPDADRPYYSSIINVPQIFSTVWEIRNIFSKDILNVDLHKYKGKQCSIFMYPLSKLPFEGYKYDGAEIRAVILSYRNKVICSYIEFISESRDFPPISLKGESIEDLSDTKWNLWKSKLDDDDNKRLVIWQYYDALRSDNYDEAYSYIYNKNEIKKQDFIVAAKEKFPGYIEFLSLEQYREPSNSECFFTAKVNVKANNKNKIYEILFDLKKDPSSKEYGGWKILSTRIK